MLSYQIILLKISDINTVKSAQQFKLTIFMSFFIVQKTN